MTLFLLLQVCNAQMMSCGLSFAEVFDYQIKFIQNLVHNLLGQLFMLIFAFGYPGPKCLRQP